MQYQCGGYCGWRYPAGSMAKSAAVEMAAGVALAYMSRRNPWLQLHRQ